MEARALELESTKVKHAEEPGKLLGALRDLPHTIFLDSAQTGPFARSSIVAIGAREALRWNQGDTHDPFDALSSLLARHQVQAEASVPFPGGMIGWIGYEARHLLEVLPGRKPTRGELPDFWMAESRLTLIIDHERAETRLLRLRDPAGGSDEAYWDAVEAQAHERIEHCANQVDRVPQRLEVAYPPASAHRDRVRAIRELILEGEVYQANVGQAFSVADVADRLALYLALREANPPTFGAFVDLGEDGALLSVSPERFLEVRGRRVVTRPIKGTIPRGRTQVEDAAAVAELEASAKDRAELAMIVDVLRNDLSRVAKVGSVRVERALEVESHPTVHHLVAEVSAELESGCDRVDLLRATFPGGSITGAPRIRAMEVIDELEDFRRGPWCGSLLYLGYDGGMDSNILIRTLFTRGRRLVFPGGGGITIDSDPELEHQESLAKIEGIVRALRADAESS